MNELNISIKPVQLRQVGSVWIKVRKEPFQVFYALVDEKGQELPDFQIGDIGYYESEAQAERIKAEIENSPELIEATLEYFAKINEDQAA